jgi:hypothetical protein
LALPLTLFVCTIARETNLSRTHTHHPSQHVVHSKLQFASNGGKAVRMLGVPSRPMSLIAVTASGREVPFHRMPDGEIGPTVSAGADDDGDEGNVTCAAFVPAMDTVGGVSTDTGSVVIGLEGGGVRLVPIG